MDAQLEDWRSRGRSFDYLGFEVFYRREGTGPVLLLIHGYPFSSFDWHPIWLALTERFTVIAPDMLGMGFSAKPVEYEYSVHDHADMHEALLAHLGVSECHVLAHDVGDSVAQELLSRYEERESGSRPYGSVDHLAQRRHVLRGLPAAADADANGQDAAGRTLREVPAALPARRGVRPASTSCSDRTPSRRTSSGGSSARSWTTTTAAASRTRSVASSSIVPPPQPLGAGDARDERADAPHRRAIDPNSGRHMADRYTELIPKPDVVLLGDDIGHWPQIEDPHGVLTHFLEFVECSRSAPRVPPHEPDGISARWSAILACATRHLATRIIAVNAAIRLLLWSQRSRATGRRPPDRSGRRERPGSNARRGPTRSLGIREHRRRALPHSRRSNDSARGNPPSDRRPVLSNEFAATPAPHSDRPTGPGTHLHGVRCSEAGDGTAATGRAGRNRANASRNTTVPSLLVSPGPVRDLPGSVRLASVAVASTDQDSVGQPSRG